MRRLVTVTFAAAVGDRYSCVDGAWSLTELTVANVETIVSVSAADCEWVMRSGRMAGFID